MPRDLRPATTEPIKSSDLPRLKSPSPDSKKPKRSQSPSTSRMEPDTPSRLQLVHTKSVDADIKPYVQALNMLDLESVLELQNDTVPEDRRLSREQVCVLTSTIEWTFSDLSSGTTSIQALRRAIARHIHISRYYRRSHIKGRQAIVSSSCRHCTIRGICILWNARSQIRIARSRNCAQDITPTSRRIKTRILCGGTHATY